ncbi:HAD family hydrolase [Marinobacterium aestuariivivens]|uniref:HAD family hydrolase n=1 Tax=Marinobacterium aestuariivivens TaxID=1698799 RepID=A0ABW1ZSX3_9GAMM
MANTDINWLRECRHWIFDLDGTLTLPVHDFNHIRCELGIPQAADILDWLAALPEPERSERVRRLDELEHHYARQAQPAEGLHPLLESLAQRRCRLGILTRNSRELALLSLAAIGVAHHFEPPFVLGRDEARPKPDPGGLRHLLACWNASPAQALMVGDFRYDLEAGRGAGMQTVHVVPRQAPSGRN